MAMGDLAIAPSDTLQIWGGTGEEDSCDEESGAGDGRTVSSSAGDRRTVADGRLSWSFATSSFFENKGRIATRM